MERKGITMPLFNTRQQYWSDSIKDIKQNLKPEIYKKEGLLIFLQKTYFLTISDIEDVSSKYPNVKFNESQEKAKLGVWGSEEKLDLIIEGGLINLLCEKFDIQDEMRLKNPLIFSPSFGKVFLVGYDLPDRGSGGWFPWNGNPTYNP